MTAPRKLAAFAVVLAAAFGLGVGAGAVAGPSEDDTPDTPAGHEHEWGPDDDAH